MEGEGLSGGAVGGAATGGGGGFESIGGSSPSVGSAGSPSVNVFEGPAIETLSPEPMGTEPASPVLSPEIVTIEAGIIDAVRKEGTPEAGFEFLADVPIPGEDPISPAPEAGFPSGDAPEVPLTPEQDQIHNFSRSNPEMLTAFGQMVNLGPEAMQFLMQALKKSLEEEREKAKDEEEKKKLSKWEIGILALLFVLQLAVSAVEKGAKESTR